MRLSILIPAHNEEKTLAEVLQKVFKVDLLGWEREVIVVNDGSSDGTKAILESLQNTDLKIIHHEENLGKGAAVKTALEKATGDYVIIQDADTEYFPEDIPRMLSIIHTPHPSPLPQGEREGAIAVFGNRGTKAYPERGFHYVIGAKLLTWWFNLLYGVWIRDLYTCYKLIPTSIIKSLNLQSAGFEFEAEVACKLAKANVKIKEVPIQYQPRSKNQGKHIGLSDAFKGFWTIIKYRI